MQILSLGYVKTLARTQNVELEKFVFPIRKYVYRCCIAHVSNMNVVSSLFVCRKWVKQSNYVRGLASRSQIVNLPFKEDE